MYCIWYTARVHTFFKLLPLPTLRRSKNFTSCRDKVWLLWHMRSGRQLNQYETPRSYIFALLYADILILRKLKAILTSPQWTLMHNEDGRSPGKSLIYTTFRVVWCDLHMNTNLLPGNLILYSVFCMKTPSSGDKMQGKFILKCLVSY